MSERTSYAAGTPSWVDMGSKDPAASAAFYKALFGWDTEFSEEAGGYGIATLHGKLVAGLGPAQDPNMPSFWSVYVTVDDCDGSVAKAKAAGATVIVDSMDVMEAGRMAVLQDPVGSFVSLWQAGETIGCELVNETGTFTWNELSTTDLAKANDFYTNVFGWGITPEGSGDTASIFTLDGNVLCGAHAAGDGEFPAWSVWFSVDDCDASAAKVTELGGSILMPPNDMDFGRGAVVADINGAAFGIGKMSGDVG
jgi:predicted enzyme related to lactoylglutathione lyase